MKICMIGGTELSGSYGAKDLILSGYQIKTITLPPLSDGAVFAKI